MHMRSLGFLFVLVAALSSWMGAASAAESLSPFEDPTTHLWGYRNAAGSVVIKPQFTVAQEFSAHGIAAVADDSGWQYIDRKGKVRIRPFLFDNGPDPFQEGLARFKKGGRVGFFDERGRVVIPPRFDFVVPFAEGRAAFCQGCREEQEGEHGTLVGGLWGFIDRKGRIVIAPTFEKADSFEGGKARVMRKGRWVAIDKKGTPVR